jgi:signal transduction histidine kinase/ABC-type nitrate/sulfonate/bicarbonate transport system substrate-binding protein
MRSLTLALCLLFTLASVNAQPLTKVSVRLKWFHQFQFAGFYAAKEKGFYADEGLDVTLNERDIKTAPYQDVLTGRDTFGISDASLFYLRLKGKPLVLVAALYQHSPLVLISLAEKNIVSPLELKDKKLMYQIGVDDAIITALFNAFGMSAKDYTSVKHSFKQDALLTSDIDAMSAYLGNQTFYYASKNRKLNIINPANYGVDLYGDMLFTSEAVAQKNPQLVAKFRKATIKGWYYALQNPEEIAEIIIKKYTKRKSKPQLLHEAKYIKRSIVPESIDIGHLSRARIEFMTNIYRKWYPNLKGRSLGNFIYSDYIKSEDTSFYIKLFGSVALTLFVIIFLLYQNRKKHIAQLQSEYSEKEQKFKGDILTLINHELRTPLTSIRASINLLNKTLKSSLDPKSEDLFKMAERNCARLSELIEDILNAEKIATQNINFKIEKIDGVQFCKEVVERYQNIAEMNESKFIIKDHVRKEALIHVDTGRYEQVLVNILSNAAKYSWDNTDIEVHLSIIDEMFTVEVADEGDGIPESQYSQLFDRFSRLNTDATHRKQGTGLGLYIAREFIQALDGYLTFKSKVGKGTSFFISLPIATEDE